MKPGTLLSFSTKKADLPEGASVEIDGKAYRLWSRNALPVARLLQYERLVGRIGPLHQKVDADTATPEEDAAYKEAVADLAVLALDAPAALVRRLPCDAHMAIAGMAFFGFRPDVTPAPGQTQTRKMKKTTKRSGGR